MVKRRTVLCSLTASPAAVRQVGLAADLCKAFGARLVLHRNLAVAPVGASVGWMWAAEHPTESEAGVEQELRDLLVSLSGVVEAEARVTHGQPSASVLSVADAVGADLVILSTPGMTDDDVSVTEQVLDRGKHAVIAMQDSNEDSSAVSFAAAVGGTRAVLVATDLTPESRAALELAFELARVLPIELHLLHLVPYAPREGDDRGVAMEETRRRLLDLIPEGIAQRTHVHVEGGKAARRITEVALRLQAACIVMGEHTRAPLGRWFSSDTSRAVLHRAPCPVWYVPGQRSA